LTLSVPGAVHITTRALGRRSRYGGRLVASHPRQCSTLGRWKLRSSCCSRSRQPALVFTLIKIVRRYAEVLDQQTCWCWSSDTPHSPTATLAVPRPRLCPPAHRRRRHLRHRHPRRPEPHRLNHLTASESAVATHSAALRRTGLDRVATRTLAIRHPHPDIAAGRLMRRHVSQS
jgi:hypothetical protein